MPTKLDPPPTNMSPGLMPAERRNRILETLGAQGSVRVAPLSDNLGVTEITIRRDLKELERQGLLERTHGGAIQSHRMRLEPLYTEKHLLHQEKKHAIGAVAAALVEDGDILLINSGSTTLRLFRHLAGRKNLRVVTSNVGAFRETQGLDVELLLIGGVYREQSNSLVGPLAMLSLQQVCGSKCFIGVDGIDRKHGLTTPSLQEAEIARTMIERTNGPLIVVADHSKLGVVADFRTAPLEKVSTLVVDDSFDEGYREELEELGIQILVAPA